MDESRWLRRLLINNFSIYFFWMSKTRTEHDSLWSLKIVKDAPRGIYTQRVLNTYPQLGIQTVPESLLREYIRSKMIYATVNTRFRKMDQTSKKAIIAAGRELLALDSEAFLRFFPIGQMQSGGGTCTNMMINEVMANLASRQLGKKFGSGRISSHDHLNLSQSSNDTFPGVTKLTVLQLWNTLESLLTKNITILKNKARSRKTIKKVWRTHLQDAVVISLGDEFAAYARTLDKEKKYLQQSMQTIKELPFGGTATWSLQNITPAIRKELIREFSKVYKMKFVQAKSYFEQNSSSWDLAHVSMTLAHLASSLIKITNDLRLLSSGPLAGFAELQLPTVHPGSSIMPGKINPSVLEASTMSCAKVIGNDHTIQLLHRQAQLELQQFVPGSWFALISSLQELIATLDMLHNKCLKWIQPNKKNIHDTLEWSFAYATDYTEKLGYETVAMLVKKALKEKKNLRDLLKRYWM